MNNYSLIRLISWISSSVDIALVVSKEYLSLSVVSVNSNIVHSTGAHEQFGFIVGKTPGLGKNLWIRWITFGWDLHCIPKCRLFYRFRNHLFDNHTLYQKYLLLVQCHNNHKQD